VLRDIVFSNVRVADLHEIALRELKARASEFEPLVQGRDEEGLIRFLEGAPISPEAQRIVALLKRTREISTKLNVYWRAIPQPHGEIEKGYQELRTIRAELGRVRGFE
jgi:hypothetical protein